MSDHKCEHHKEKGSSKDAFNNGCAGACHKTKTQNEHSTDDGCGAKACNNNKGCCKPAQP